MELFQDIVTRASQAAHISLGKNELEQFAVFRRELLLWNKTMSLVSLKDPSDLPIKHIIDSLTILPYLSRRHASILDLGSGGGFPGIPVKIMRNDLKITFVDGSRKKGSFLKHALRTLDMADVTVVVQRIENLMREGRLYGAFDYVITRATFKVSQLLPMADYFLSRNGVMISMKGNTWKQELYDADDVIKSFNFRVVDAHELALPIIGNRRAILLLGRT